MKHKRTMGHKPEARAIRLRLLRRSFTRKDYDWYRNTNKPRLIITQHVHNIHSLLRHCLRPIETRGDPKTKPPPLPPPPKPGVPGTGSTASQGTNFDPWSVNRLRSMPSSSQECDSSRLGTRGRGRGTTLPPPPL